MSLVFLLNRRYAPFYKWMHRALKDLPALGGVVHGLLSELVISCEFDEKTRLIEEICANVIDELRPNGLSDSVSDFLLDHGPRVQAKIQDPDLRNMNVWVE
jgi:hypothetical protein